MTDPSSARSTPASVECSLALQSLQGMLYRCRVDRPMVTSFARLYERSSLLVCLQDADGTQGWGEAYCNFPPNAGEHRLALLRALFAPMVLDSGPWESPTALYAALQARSDVLALQSGEIGPIAQCIAAIDIAAWDLVARRAQLPLARLLADTPRQQVPGYCTGIAPDGALAVIEREQARGHRRFKLKLGFGRETDLRHLAEATDRVGPGCIALDPNQAWTLDEARSMSDALARFEPVWLEEPLRADAPLADWKTLAAHSPIPLAAGENLYSPARFDDLIDSRSVAFVQPDPVKWGGISGTAEVARRAAAAGLCFCPHYIGSGLGWMSTVHLVAALGDANSLVEVDPNENPLREVLARELPPLDEGRYRLPDAPGLGVLPDLSAAEPWLVGRISVGRTGAAAPP